MFLVHRVLHPATGVSRCCWARVWSDELELVVARGCALEVYGVVDGCLMLRCAFRFEASVCDVCCCGRPRGSRDALVLSFASAKVVLVDVDGADGSLRDLALFDLEAGDRGGLGAFAVDDVYDRPFASATAEKAAPVLACAGDGSSAACLALGRLLIVPLLSAPGSGSGGDARADPPAPFVVGGAVQRRGEVPRFFEYLPSDASRVAVVLGDARGDVPKSTRVVVAGVDVASRRCYVVWAVDGLPPLAQGLGTLRGGGLVVLFRNSLARIRDGGAPAARCNFPST